MGGAEETAGPGNAAFEDHFLAQRCVCACVCFGPVNIFLYNQSYFSSAPLKALCTYLEHVYNSVFLTSSCICVCRRAGPEERDPFGPMGEGSEVHHPLPGQYHPHIVFNIKWHFFGNHSHCGMTHFRRAGHIS